MTRNWRSFQGPKYGTLFGLGNFGEWLPLAVTSHHRRSLVSLDAFTELAPWSGLAGESQFSQGLFLDLHVQSIGCRVQSKVEGQSIQRPLVILSLSWVFHYVSPRLIPPSVRPSSVHKSSQFLRGFGGCSQRRIPGTYGEVASRLFLLHRQDLYMSQHGGCPKHCK